MNLLTQLPNRFPWRFKRFQIEDVARAALHDGAILADEPGLGKTMQGIAWAIIKEARRVLIVAPGSLHRQWREEAQKFFRIHVTALPDVRTFKALGLDRTPVTNHQSPVTPRFYLTSYQDLGLNGADEWPDDIGEDGLREGNERRIKARYLDPAFRTIQTVLAKLDGRDFKPEKYFEGIGEERTYEMTNDGMTNDETDSAADRHSSFGFRHSHTIRCVWLPTLARVIAASEAVGGGFDCVIVDEGTRLQSTDSAIGQAVRMLAPRYRLVLTGTPIKNRLESFFWLAWWACGGSPMPTARWPYEGSGEAREQFASQHLQHDRFLTREQESAGGRQAGQVFVPQDVFDALQSATVGTQ